VVSGHDGALSTSPCCRVERLTAWADILDRINIFPIADGDTGRNLDQSAWLPFDTPTVTVKPSLAISFSPPEGIRAISPTGFSSLLFRSIRGKAFPALSSWERPRLAGPCRILGRERCSPCLTPCRQFFPTPASCPVLKGYVKILTHLETVVRNTTDHSPGSAKRGWWMRALWACSCISRAFSMWLAGGGNPLSSRDGNLSDRFRSRHLL